MSKPGDISVVDEMAAVVTDQQAREFALGPDRSYIVQAPAGSGKTSLLVQRILRLLACVERPEQILAITFTRKAAGEMHNRVIAALHRAANDEPPESDYDRRFWNLARDVRNRDAKLDWQLLNCPARLKIQTIDAFNASLVHRLPLLSDTGTPPQATDNTDTLYEEAAYRTIELLGDDGEAGDKVASLLQHLDGHTEYVVRLLVDMLRRRDHWMRQVVGRSADAELRPAIEAGLKRLVESEIHKTIDCVPADVIDDLVDLAGIAAKRIVETKPNSLIAQCAVIDADSLATDVALWRGLGDLLLTSANQWRKTVNRNTGFPTDDKDSKQRMLDLLDKLSSDDHLLRRMVLTRGLPDGQYRDEQWSVVDSLLYVLPRAAAQLTLVFREYGESDHVEIAQAALRALKSDDAPTDLALALDYGIHHILVDEFQDTSVSQFELLESLTEGWQPGDGNTLFCVGDPMQSIYRFREAEVSIFLRAWQHGIGQVILTPLKLTKNFRSQAGIVDWVNRSFAVVLPEKSDLSRGAVSYAASTAECESLDGTAVSVHPSFADDRLHEAQTILRLIEDAAGEEYNSTTAVLVRSRSHLVELVSLLRESNTRFLAVELENLTRRPMIQDLMALTRALLHDGDRSSWLALLRAPWCGLTADDLYSIASEQRSALVPDLIHDNEVVGQLSDDGKQRLRCFVDVLDTVRARKHQTGLHRWVESAWLALAGPATLQRESELEDAEAYFALLRSLEVAGDLEDITRLEDHVSRLFASADPHAGNELQLMTIHKAKGLEFDTVIVPGLGRRTGQNSSRLLHWLEVTRDDSGVDLMLAPIGKTGGDQDALHRYLRDVDKERDLLEQSRLMYVAATRAARRLHLLGHVNTREQDDDIVLGNPHKGTLLSQLWPALHQEYETAFASADPVRGEENTIEKEKDMRLRRLVSGWQIPLLPGPVAGSPVDSAAGPDHATEIHFDWAGELARLTGSIVHKELELIAGEGLSGWSQDRVASRRAIYRTELRRSGIPEAQCGLAVERICHALTETLDDERGRWILSHDHEDAHSELALSSLEDGRLHTWIIDRTFVDEHGTRWIIDFKVGSHEGSATETFLDEEQRRYSPQLEKYGALMSQRENREIRLALYFPLVSGWRCWSADQ